MKSILKIFVLITAPYAFAHGGGGGGDHKEEKKAEVRTVSRAVPQKPEEIDQAELMQFLANNMSMADVATISCQLGEYTKCRGVEIGLYNSKGKLVAKGHSGTSGVVGFQGLKPHVHFVAKIEGEKYRGETVVEAGGSFGIQAERR